MVRILQTGLIHFHHLLSKRKFFAVLMTAVAKHEFK